MSNQHSAQKSKLSVVIPIFNEEKDLYENVLKINEHIKQAELSYEIIIVDDGSKDKSWKVISKLSNKYNYIHGVKLSRNFGKEAAIMCGLENSVGNAAIILDSDLQHPPELIPKMAQIWKATDVDIINAKKSRRQKEFFIKSLAVKLFYKIMENFSGIKLSGATDFKLLNRKAIEAYLSLPENNRFFRALIPWVGLEQYDIEFNVPQIEVRKSKWSFFKLLKLSINAIMSFSAIPLRVVTFLGITNLTFSFILSAIALYQYFTNQSLEGFTTVIISVLFTSSIIMISLGIIGEYLGKLYEESKNRPNYIIKEKN